MTNRGEPPSQSRSVILWKQLTPTLTNGWQVTETIRVNLIQWILIPDVWLITIYQGIPILIIPDCTCCPVACSLLSALLHSVATQNIMISVLVHCSLNGRIFTLCKHFLHGTAHLQILAAGCLPACLEIISFTTKYESGDSIMFHFNIIFSKGRK